MSGGWPAIFAEHGTRLVSGEAVDLNGRRSLYTDRDGKTHLNHAVLSDAEAAVYTRANVLGEWDPVQLTRDATPVRDVRLVKGRLSWTGSDDALLYAICRNGKVVDFTVDTTYNIGKAAKTDRWSVRAANQMGGLGAAVEAAK